LQYLRNWDTAAAFTEQPAPLSAQCGQVEQEGIMVTLFTMVWFANIVFDTAGHLAFKAASMKADRYDGWEHWRAMLGGPLLWLGLAAFVVEFFLWLALLTLAPLAQGVLIGSASIVGVMIGGRLFFREEITPPRAAAAALIAVGVLLVGWSEA
jgi:drug/metabolite transporter (DMT)-like permease